MKENENKDCGKIIKTDIDKCGESGSNDVKNVTNTDLKPNCSAARKVADCMIKKPKKNVKILKRNLRII